MEWTDQFLPWRLEKLSDDEYTAKIDELVALDLSIPENLQKSIAARYFLHIGALSRRSTHPDVMNDIHHGISVLSTKVPWDIKRMTNDELLEADRILGKVYA